MVPKKPKVSLFARKTQKTKGHFCLQNIDKNCIVPKNPKGGPSGLPSTFESLKILIKQKDLMLARNLSN